MRLLIYCSANKRIHELFESLSYLRNEYIKTNVEYD